jgi:hypothetical protein
MLGKLQVARGDSGNLVLQDAQENACHGKKSECRSYSAGVRGWCAAFCVADDHGSVQSKPAGAVLRGAELEARERVLGRLRNGHRRPFCSLGACCCAEVRGMRHGIDGITREHPNCLAAEFRLCGWIKFSQGQAATGTGPCVTRLPTESRAGLTLDEPHRTATLRADGSRSIQRCHAKSFAPILRSQLQTYRQVERRHWAITLQRSCTRW